MTTIKIINAVSQWRTPGSAVTWLQLSDVKAHLNIETADEDNLLLKYINSAVAYIEGFTGRDLSDHSQFYTFEVSDEGMFYVFDGVAVQASECRKHEEIYQGLTNYDNQVIINHSIAPHPGNLKSVFIKPDLLDTKFFTLKNTIEYTPADFTHIQAAGYSLVAEFYRNREFISRSASVNRVIYDTLSSFRRQ